MRGVRGPRLPGFRAGCPPRNKGLRFPADPPRVEEIIAVMRAAGSGVHGLRMRGLVVVLWRAGLRINEALSLAETDLEARRGAILVRHGKGDKRREVGMDEWAWEHLDPWARYRLSLPAGPFSASWRERPAGGGGHSQAPGLSYGAWRGWPGCAGGLYLTSFGMLTRSRWPGRECRCR